MIKKLKLVAICGALLIAACSESTLSDPPTVKPMEPPAPAAPEPSVRVYRSPYRFVSFTNDLLVKAQHHDHTGNNPVALKAYEAAGYQVVSLMTYSGVASLTYTWHERRWPADRWLPPQFLASLKNIKLFIPNGEEVGGGYHVTSPFMTDYVAKWEPGYYPTRTAFHYDDSQQLIDLIKRYGGVPIIAHPAGAPLAQANLRGFAGMEIYSAYYMASQRKAPQDGDKNAVMQVNWDIALEKDQTLLGIAVNDHHGPDQTHVDLDIRDSGKILVWVPELTLAAYGTSFRNGAFVAVKDLGTTKDLYPVVQRIAITDSTIQIVTNDESAKVKWIGSASLSREGATLNLKQLPLTTKFVRAEISNAAGSTVYTQAFTIRLVGDVNGDGFSDADDAIICVDVNALRDTVPEHVDACRAIGTNR